MRPNGPETNCELLTAGPTAKKNLSPGSAGNPPPFRGGHGPWMLRRRVHMLRAPCPADSFARKRKPTSRRRFLHRLRRRDIAPRFRSTSNFRRLFHIPSLTQRAPQYWLDRRRAFAQRSRFWWSPFVPAFLSYAVKAESYLPIINFAIVCNC